MRERTILNVIRALGWTQLSFVADHINFQVFKDFKRSSANGVYTSFMTINQSLEQGYDLLSEPVPYIHLESSNDSIKAMEQYGRFRKPSLTFGLVGEKGIESTFKDTNVSTAFFRIDPEFEKVTYVQTFTNTDVYVANQWEHSKGSKYFKEEFNLGGAPFKCSTLPYEPWLYLHGCDSYGRNCSTSGILPDFLDILAASYNFTWFCDRATDGVWGEFPPTNSTFNFGTAHQSSGSISDVLVGGYDTPLSIWTYSALRWKWLDFPWSVAPLEIDAVINVKKPPTDYSLILRPFSNASWVLTLSVILLCYPLLKMVSSKQFTTDSQNMFHATVGLFHLLLLAHYCGVLTSFFSSPPSLPFESLIDGLNMFPEFKMVHVKGKKIWTGP